MGPTSKAEMNERKLIVSELLLQMLGEAKTLHARAVNDESDNYGGRFGVAKRADQIAKSTVVGSMNSPSQAYPPLPQTHALWPDGNAEPTIDGTECGNVFDGTLTRGHPDRDDMALLAPPPSSCSVGVSGTELAPTKTTLVVDDTPSQTFDRRGF